MSSTQPRTPSQVKIKRLALSGLFLALGLLLPFLTGQIPQIGSRLSPMHIPVLLAGFICGAPTALAVGFVTPLLRSLLFGMPPLMPTALAMAFELAAYGAAAGLISRALGRSIPMVYLSLIGAMLAGRIVWGVVSFILYSILGNPYTWQTFAAGAFVNAVPGIILHIVIIPPLALALWKVDKSL
ncbi:MAG: ECF transporter S component [Oscillospiraceae bacterium]|jgi:riboflavin transporter FmnP|nr:ECF transporter S component [Oscillospiraceae bacterium]